jgi:pimeloyl-ACP methyl ester carboxylesterase
VLTGILYEWNARSRVASNHPVPGRLVDLGDRSLHLDCRGAGAPTVVFEAGLDANGSLAWSAVHDSIAATTRACAYDRAGIMWSSPAAKGEVRDAKAVAADLGRLLDASAEPGPYVVVGHSLGGPYALVFTASRPADVAGLVFVDASHPDQEARLRPAVGDLMEKGKSLMQVAKALATVGAMRLFLLPKPEQFPGFPPEKLAVAGAFQPQGFAAVVAEANAIQATMADARGATDLGDRPLVVLTALRPMTPAELAQMQITESQGVAMKAVWDTLHVEEAGFSSSGRQVRVPDAGHYVQFDRPDLVIAAVREVIDSVRQRAVSLVK